jgi:hypothetical protein
MLPHDLTFFCFLLVFREIDVFLTGSASSSTDGMISSAEWWSDSGDAEVLDTLRAFSEDPALAGRDLVGDASPGVDSCPKKKYLLDGVFGVKGGSGMRTECSTGEEVELRRCSPLMSSVK